MQHALALELAERPVIPDSKVLFDYLKTRMAHLNAEQFRVLYLTGQNSLIRDEVIAEGTLDMVHAHEREIIHRGLELGAANLVLAHNHPSGDSKPSEADIRFTKRLQAVAVPLALWVLDHVVVGRENCTSMRMHGLYGQ